MPSKKVKFMLRMEPEVQQLVKDTYPKNNCHSQNEFIEQAIRFYAGYVVSNESNDFLPLLYRRKLQALIQNTEMHICRLLFKLTVELDMTMNVLAAGMDVPEEQLEELRSRCMKNVKKTSGGISLNDAVRFQNGE